MKKYCSRRSVEFKALLGQGKVSLCRSKKMKIDATAKLLSLADEILDNSFQFEGGSGASSILINEKTGKSQEKGLT